MWGSMTVTDNEEDSYILVLRSRLQSSTPTGTAAVGTRKADPCRALSKQKAYCRKSDDIGPMCSSALFQAWASTVLS